jgi:hypothetical protein
VQAQPLVFESAGAGGAASLAPASVIVAASVPASGASGAVLSMKRPRMRMLPVASSSK